MALLELEDLHVYYGGVHALKGISLDVREGQIVTLIGPNGAGKTTTLRTICGLVRPRTGGIVFDGKDIKEMDPPEIVEAGIAMVPEGRRVFAKLSVRENLQMGAWTRQDSGGTERDMERIFGLFPVLKERYSQRAGTLSGGEQQMLAIGRAMMSGPRLLLMDEPSLGLAPILVSELFKTIRRVHEEGLTILLVEQNCRMSLKVADYGYVLETGNIVLKGTAEQLASNPRVQQAYLGR
jgi:branched-chain amino acid transport system ATP-binding protein